MKAWEYEAVGYEGSIYCIDCLPDGIDMQTGTVTPIFESSEWATYPVCCVCGHEHDYVGLIGNKYENGEGRFWIHDDPEIKPYGNITLGIVDENEGGIVIFVGSKELAQQLLEFLISTEQ